MPAAVDLTQPQIRYSGLPDCALGRLNVAGIKIDSRGTEAPATPGAFRRWPHFALVYTLSGEAEYCDGHGLRATLRPGDLLTVFPMFPQSFFPKAGARWSEVFIDFEGPVFDLWLREGLLDPRKPICRVRPVPYWARRIWEVAECGAHPGPEESLVRVSMLVKLLADVAQRSSLQQSATDEQWLADARRSLEAPTLSQANLRAAAKQMRMSYDHFRQKFARLAGVPPKKYADRHIMERACQLLLAGDKSESIAKDLGFSDEFHFSKRFRETMGIPPRAFKQLSRNTKIG